MKFLCYVERVSVGVNVGGRFRRVLGRVEKLLVWIFRKIIIVVLW